MGQNGTDDGKREFTRAVRFVISRGLGSSGEKCAPSVVVSQSIGSLARWRGVLKTASDISHTAYSVINTTPSGGTSLLIRIVGLARVPTTRSPLFGPIVGREKQAGSAYCE